MFILLNVALSIVLFPLALIFGRPQKVMLCRRVVDERVNKAFPISSWTPFIDFVPWGWFQKVMIKRGVGAVTFLCWVYFRPWEQRKVLEFHEAIHVIQQSVVSPVIVGLAYLTDLIVYLPFRKWFKPEELLRASTVEKVAYRVAGQDKD